MYPQRNPYSIYGGGDRSQINRQPSWRSVPVSQIQIQPQPQPPPQSQQQKQRQQQPPQLLLVKPELNKEESKKEESKKELPNPIPPSRIISFPSAKPEAKEELKKEEPPKPILPGRLLSSSAAKPEAKEEPKKEDQQKAPILELIKEDPKPKSTLPPKEPSPSRKSVLSETSKDEKMSIVPVDKAEKTMVKAGSPAPQERSLQQGLKEDVVNLTHKLAELNAGEQQKSGNSQQDLGVRVITLAGENRGATMDFGPEGRKNENMFDLRAGRKVGEYGKNEESPDKKGNGRHSSSSGPISAYVNSNVQAANNSILYNSTCPHRDPGVRLQLSNAPVKSKDAGAKEDTVKAIKAPKNPA